MRICACYERHAPSLPYIRHVRAAVVAATLPPGPSAPITAGGAGAVSEMLIIADDSCLLLPLGLD